METAKFLFKIDKVTEDGFPSEGVVVTIEHFIPEPHKEIGIYCNYNSKGNVLSPWPEEDVNSYKSQIEDWIQLNFNFFVSTAEMQSTVEEIVIFSLLTNPSKNILSEESILYGIIMAWMVMFDNWIDDNTTNRENPTDKKFNKILLTIIKSVFNTDSSKPDIEINTEADKPLLQILGSVADIKSRFEQINKHGINNVKSEIKKTIESMLWKKEVQFPEKVYNIETFKYWRNLDSAFTVIIKYLAAVKNITLEKADFNHPIIRRMMDLCSGIMFEKNDLCGLKSDYERKTTVNVVRYFVGKGIPIIEAIRKVKASLNEDIADYVSLRETVQALFAEKPEVQSFIEMLDNLSFGHFLVMASSPKYGMKDNVEIYHDLDEAHLARG